MNISTITFVSLILLSGGIQFAEATHQGVPVGDCPDGQEYVGIYDLFEEGISTHEYACFDFDYIVDNSTCAVSWWDGFEDPSSGHPFAAIGLADKTYIWYFQSDHRELDRTLLNNDLVIVCDWDNDGLPDYDEARFFNTDPYVADTDGDGFDDGEEIDIGTNPLLPDYLAQGILDRVEIDHDDIPSDIAADDLFGYYIETINDLDSDGVVDLAVIKFSDDSGEADAGSVLIMFMNNDGTVKTTNEITMDVSGIGSSCIADGSTNRESTSLEQLAFVGDLDGDGEPTLAVGAADNEYGGRNTGVIYMLELNTIGTVNNCLKIIPGENGFYPSDEFYHEASGAFLGWPLIATDLNGDGQNELIIGASNDADTSTNLWPLFLNSTGGVDSHPDTPIFGITDLRLDSGDFIDDGDTVDGDNKVVVGAARSGASDNGSIFVVNIDSYGVFTSTTEITGTSLGLVDNSGDRFGSGVAKIDDMDADGVKDILVGNTSGDDMNITSGEAYILYLNRDDSVKKSQKISNLSEFVRTGTAPFAESDFFGHGMALWKEDGTNAVIAISTHGDDTGGQNAGAIHLFTIQFPLVGEPQQFQSSITVYGFQQTVTSSITVVDPTPEEPSPPAEKKITKKSSGKKGGGGRTGVGPSGEGPTMFNGPGIRTDPIKEIYIDYLKRYLGYEEDSLEAQVLLSLFGFRGNDIPAWNKNTILWTVEGKITLDDLEESLRWQYENKIIK